MHRFYVTGIRSGKCSFNGWYFNRRFGMRLIFPVAIVAVTADMGMIEVAKLALNDPKTYSERLMAHHAEISAFGGTFLLLVFLNFFDEEKETHWFRWLEAKLSSLASVPAMSVLLL